MKAIKSFISSYPFLLVYVLAIGLRFPLFLSVNFNLDGDESIVGLMAKHLLVGQEFPLFFYGQSYGFSFFEVLPIALSFALFGVSKLALKGAMLALWLLGVYLFYRTLTLISSKKWSPVIITLLLVSSPFFYLWSMKARGGYLSGFVLTFFASYILFHKGIHKRVKTGIVGVLIVFIYQAQALWLVGLLPILFFPIVFKTSIKSKLALILGLICASLLFYWIKLPLSHFWEPQVLALEFFENNSLEKVSQLIFINLTGTYLYGEYIQPSEIIEILSWIYIIGLTSLFGFGAFQFSKKKWGLKQLGIWGSPFIYIAVAFFTDANNARYLLPLGVFTLFSFFFIVKEMRINRWMNLNILLLIALGSVSVIDFKSYSFEEDHAQEKLVVQLEENGITHLFCDNGLLQWKLMFLSNEKLIARYHSKNDRYQPYIEDVQMTWEKTPNQSAYLGIYQMSSTDSASGCVRVESPYFYCENPSRELLEFHNFQLLE